MIFRSVLGKDIELTEERKRHILTFHPDIKPYRKLFTEVLLEPDEIRVSKRDKNVLLFYRYFGKIKLRKYLVVVVKVNRRAFILTTYLTKRKLSGEVYEK